MGATRQGQDQDQGQRQDQGPGQGQGQDRRAAGYCVFSPGHPGHEFLSDGSNRCRLVGSFSPKSGLKAP